ncbi:YezD family protein [Lysobacter sp. CFH 32150]|uniref:YezD family protein n=1 Tax=Lysobacter sp. CFH 32150 TaxID=2927128 RepID=UPI001FA6B689|nr:YezD family protein [Lysobacter sp. CFH 32150]MCI4569174.1 YezD family protein [Lysobacter sp. CFH 32150]
MNRAPIDHLAIGTKPVSREDQVFYAASLSDGEAAVLRALREIAYGHVEVVVHGARIVQITRSQKLRVDGGNHR